MTLCECGCGKDVKSGNRFIHGHSGGKRKHSTKTRNKISSTLKKYYSDPIVRENLKKNAIERWNDPIIRERTVNAQQEYWADLINREKFSAKLQGIPYDEWEDFATEYDYCPSFNEKCRESNREKYGRMCFLTGLPESENLTRDSKQQRLSVHHVDMDKDQGCNDKRWRLVPLCIEWHSKVHNELWESRIIWLLKNVWNQP